MELITKDLRDRLILNGTIRHYPERHGLPGAEIDPYPIVKLFTPDGSCTWLLSELDPEDDDCAFGLCDLGMGYPELGCVLISELIALRGKIGLPVERDLHFVPTMTIGEYAADAARHGYIRA